jgi:hypothetical protein
MKAVVKGGGCGNAARVQGGRVAGGRRGRRPRPAAAASTRRSPAAPLHPTQGDARHSRLGSNTLGSHSVGFFTGHSVGGARGGAGATSAAARRAAARAAAAAGGWVAAGGGRRAIWGRSGPYSPAGPPAAPGTHCPRTPRCWRPRTRRRWGRRTPAGAARGARGGGGAGVGPRPTASGAARPGWPHPPMPRAHHACEGQHARGGQQSPGESHCCDVVGGGSDRGLGAAAGDLCEEYK